MENWVSKLKFTQKNFNEVHNVPLTEPILECEFTDIVIIGGDGMYNLFLNTIYKHHYFEVLVKIPVGILPAGSSNALWCDLGGKEPLRSSINIVRRNIVSGDIFKVDFDNK